MRRSRHRQGFTLPELMVVVTMMGVIAAVAIPRLGSRGRQARDSRAWAQRVVTLLDQTRTLAVAERMPYRVTVDPQKVTIDRSSDGTTTNWTTQVTQQANRDAQVWAVTQARTQPTARGSDSLAATFFPDFTVQIKLNGGTTLLTNAYIWISGDTSGAGGGSQYMVMLIGTGAARLFESW